ncbi:hypothetical protein OSB04_007161 [Centaurea solstitialis]|uniref:Uncharacterized protein n=1 Tax=Centaurea solstitialis TaxID=347529 RepID=A0AA38TUW4_9ASTR|nr:hypothetical protein OSB04_007161 [Centaurea solstitialis]
MATPLVAFSSTEKTTHNSHKFGFTLSPSNCGYWKAMIQPFLITKGLFGYVDGTILCPEPLITSPGKEGTTATPTTNPSHTIWISNDAHVRMLLMSTISEASFQHVQAYLTRAQEYASALANIGQPMSEKDIVMLVVAGLRDEYNGVKQSLLARQFTAVFPKLPGILADHDSGLDFHIRNPIGFLIPTPEPAPMHTPRIGHVPSQCPNRGPSTFRSRQPSANYVDTRSHASTSWLPDTGSNNHVAPDMMGSDTTVGFFCDLEPNWYESRFKKNKLLI